MTFATYVLSGTSWLIYDSKTAGSPYFSLDQIMPLSKGASTTYFTVWHHFHLEIGTITNGGSTIKGPNFIAGSPSIFKLNSNDS